MGDHAIVSHEAKVMGHHIADQGYFKSDKYKDLGWDKVILSFTDERAWPALSMLASSYQDFDPEFSADILTRLQSLGYKP